MEDISKTLAGIYCDICRREGLGLKKFDMNEILSEYTQKRPGYGSMAGSIVPVVFYSDWKTDISAGKTN